MDRDAIIARLKDKQEWRTQSENLLASHFLTFLDSLPFQTATSIGEQLNVSPVTVGRFLRRLGYRRLSELTRDLHGSGSSFAWQSKSQVQESAKNGDGDMHKRELAAHIDNITHIYKNASAPLWQEAVAVLATSRQIFVSAFQNERGIGLYFTEQLNYARPGVEFLDGSNGTFFQLFDGDPANTCLVVIDDRRYAKHSRLLVEQAKRSGIKVIAVTDIYCPWLDQVDMALADQGERNVFWDSAVGTVALLELLLRGVIKELGATVQVRLKKLVGLQDHFGSFDSV